MGRNKIIKIDPNNRIDNIYTNIYNLEDKLDKLIKYLQDKSEDQCEKKILELISGKRPY